MVTPFAMFYVVYAIALSTVNYINVIVVIYIDMKTTKPIISKIINLNDNKFSDYHLDFKGINDGDININNLSINYDKKNIIDKLNLKILKNSKYAIVGPSGCGKSTIAKAICGLIDYEKGSINIGKEQVTSYKQKEILQKFGYVDNDPYLFIGTVKENIVLFDKTIDQNKYDKIINLLDLKEIDNGIIIDEIETNLSMGQKQRVNLARYLYLDYKYLILDESISNVDSKTVEKVEKYLLSQKDLTLINITHHLNNKFKSKYKNIINM